MSVLGSALGLGNIWKFPYVFAQYGGGAFFIPFFCVLLLIVVPIFCVEKALGKIFRSTGAQTFSKFNKHGKNLALFQLAIITIICAYYMVVISWLVISIFHGFSPTFWKSQHHPFLPKNNSGLTLGKFNIGWFLVLVGIWLIICIFLKNKFSQKLEKLNIIIIPLFFIIMTAILVYCMTLPNALTGISFVFNVQWHYVFRMDTWLAATSQAFFSASLFMLILLTFGRYSRRHQEITNTALVVTFANTLSAIMFTMIIFAFIGNQALVTPGYGAGQSNFLAYYHHYSMDYGGPTLVFNAIPQVFQTIIGKIGYFGNIIGIIFFISILFAAVTSIISILMVINAEIQGYLKQFRKYLYGTLLVPIITISILLSFSFAQVTLDTIDHWVVMYFLIFAGLIEIILLLSTTKKFQLIIKFINQHSIYSMLKYTKFFLFLTPFFLLFCLVGTVVNGSGSRDFLSFFSLASINIYVGLSICLSCFLLLIFWYIKLRKHKFNFLICLYLIIFCIIGLFITFKIVPHYNNYHFFINFVGICCSTFFVVLIITVGNLFSCKSHDNKLILNKNLIE